MRSVMSTLANFQTPSIKITMTTRLHKDWKTDHEKTRTIFLVAMCCYILPNVIWIFFEKPWFFNRNLLVLLNQNIEKKTLDINEFGNMNIGNWISQFNNLFIFQFSNVGNRQQASQARFSIYWREFLENCPKFSPTNPKMARNFWGQSKSGYRHFFKNQNFPGFLANLFLKPIIYDRVFL
jgi:hypothetical protein